MPPPNIRVYIAVVDNIGICTAGPALGDGLALSLALGEMLADPLTLPDADSLNDTLELALILGEGDKLAEPLILALMLSDADELKLLDSDGDSDADALADAEMLCEALSD